MDVLFQQGISLFSTSHWQNSHLVTSALQELDETKLLYLFWEATAKSFLKQMSFRG